MYISLSDSCYNGTEVWGQYQVNDALRCSVLHAGYNGKRKKSLAFRRKSVTLNFTRIGDRCLKFLIVNLECLVSAAS